MNVSEGHLTQQYLCDYLEHVEKTEDIHIGIVLLNLFLHRISVDGGFHARIVSSILKNDEDCDLLFSLLKEIEEKGEEETTLKDWLARSYQSSSEWRRKVLSYVFRSTISGTNTSADLYASAVFGGQESIWRSKSRRFIVDNIKNSSIYFDPGQRPAWKEYPMDAGVAALAGVSGLSNEILNDAIVCIASVWFTSLTQEEMIVWLNMPCVEQDEWEKIVSPLLDIKNPQPALSTANWLYISGNLDAALDLYAQITIQYKNTDAEKPAFEMMAVILREFGDFDNAFEAAKIAYLLSKSGGAYSYANGLKVLCGAGEEVGEDMTAFYSLIEKLKEKLTPEECLSLNFSLSALARRKHEYLEECHYLESVVSDEACSGELFAAASSRISMINSCMDETGKLNVEQLSSADAELDASLCIDRGDYAYFGFDPVSANYWYNRAITYVPEIAGELSEKLFNSAVEADLPAVAQGYAGKDSSRNAIVAAMDKLDSSTAVALLNTAVSETFGNDSSSLSSLIYKSFLYMTPDVRNRAATFLLQERTTREDEKSRIALAIGLAFLDLGYIDEAKGMYRTALRANPGNNVRARILIELAWAESECGNYNGSIDLCEQIIRLNSRFPAAYSCMAKSNIRLGKFAEAYKAAESASSLNPTDDGYIHMKIALAEVCKKPGDIEADTFFTLPGEENLVYAAALYTDGAPSSWDVRSVEDVILLR